MSVSDASLLSLISSVVIIYYKKIMYYIIFVYVYKMMLMFPMSLNDIL